MKNRSWTNGEAITHDRPNKYQHSCGRPFVLIDESTGKTALRTLQGPAYQKLKKVPVVSSEQEAQALMVQLLPL